MVRPLVFKTVTATVEINYNDDIEIVNLEMGNSEMGNNNNSSETFKMTVIQ